MDLTVHIPDDIAERLASAGGNLSRRALEGLALEEYKNGHITDPELLLLLGFETRYELDGFLKSHGVYEDFTLEDFEHDLADLHSDLEDSVPAVAPDYRPISEVIAEIMADVPPDVLDQLPKDGASQHDHYIYGWPKRDV